MPPRAIRKRVSHAVCIPKNIKFRISVPLTTSRLPSVPSTTAYTTVMDNRNNASAGQSLHELFSRGPTPPVNVQQPQPQYVTSPPHIAHNISSNQIDSLFQHLNTSSSSDHSQSQQSFNQSGGSYGSNPTTPMKDEPAPSIPANTTAQSITERQNALLSMLSGPPANQPARSVNQPPAAQSQQVQQAQQIPTPPGSSQRSNASPTNAEVQGKLLLEQLMSGCVISSHICIHCSICLYRNTCVSCMQAWVSPSLLEPPRGVRVPDLYLLSLRLNRLIHSSETLPGRPIPSLLKALITFQSTPLLRPLILLTIRPSTGLHTLLPIQSS